MIRLFVADREAIYCHQVAQLLTLPYTYNTILNSKGLHNNNKQDSELYSIATQDIRHWKASSHTHSLKMQNNNSIKIAL